MTELKQIIPPKAGDVTPIVDIEQQLADVKARYSTVPDFATKSGYKEGKQAIQALTKLRTGTDKARLAITAPHRDFVAQVNDFAKSLIAEVEALEKPHRDAKAEVDEKEERERERRHRDLRERLAREVTAYLDTAMGCGPDELAALVEEAEAIDAGRYYDLAPEAETEIARVAGELRLMRDRAQVEADRNELEREKEELARARGEVGGVDAAASRDGVDWPQEEADYEADAWASALEDLQAHCQLDATQAVEVLTTIQNGRIAHVRYHA